MWVVGNVPEKDVQFIRKDQKVDVIVSAYPHAIIWKSTYEGWASLFDGIVFRRGVEVSPPN